MYEIVARNSFLADCSASTLNHNHPDDPSKFTPEVCKILMDSEYHPLATLLNMALDILISQWLQDPCGRMLL